MLTAIVNEQFSAPTAVGIVKMLVTKDTFTGEAHLDKSLIKDICRNVPEAESLASLSYLTYSTLARAGIVSLEQAQNLVQILEGIEYTDVESFTKALGEALEIDEAYTNDYLAYINGEAKSIPAFYAQCTQD